MTHKLTLAQHRHLPLLKEPRDLRRMRIFVSTALLTVAIASYATSSKAEPITLEYVVNITERANVVQIGTTPIDPRINLSLGPSEPFSATFNLTMTFDPALSGFDPFPGHSEGGGQPGGRTRRTLYGMPTYSVIPLPNAAPLISPGEAGAETNFFGQTFEEQEFRATGESFINWGAFLVDTVQRQGDVQSGSTTLLTHIRPANLTGTDDPAFQSVPLATYLDDMRGDLEFDFVTWSLFLFAGNPDVFTADSFNYRGTANFISEEPIPEPSTMLLLGSGLAGLGFIRRRD